MMNGKAVASCLVSSMKVLLDSGILGMVANPYPRGQETLDCNDWLQKLIGAGHEVCIPEIVDYEQRRAFLLAGWQESIAKLDQLKVVLEYLPLNTEVMLQAAIFWAQAHKDSPPTDRNKRKLDVDMILAAQAKVNVKYATGVIIATTNVKDLVMFADAREWRHIPTT
jgi:predicted nucleic acid-binding protein